jgi:hypothetical protein
MCQIFWFQKLVQSQKGDILRDILKDMKELCQHAFIWVRLSQHDLKISLISLKKVMKVIIHDTNLPYFTCCRKLIQMI